MDTYNTIEKLIADQHGKTLGTRKAIGDFMLGLVQTARLAYGDPSGDFRSTMQAYYLQEITA